LDSPLVFQTVVPIRSKFTRRGSPVSFTSFDLLGEHEEFDTVVADLTEMLEDVRPPIFVGNIKGTNFPLSSLLGGEAWIVYIVNHYRRAHSKFSRDRTYTVCLRARQVLADLAGIGATACSQPKPHDEVGEIHAMRLCWLCRPTDQDSNVESKECLAFFRMLVF
jgi:hypothetical protein